MLVDIVFICRRVFVFFTFPCRQDHFYTTPIKHTHTHTYKQGAISRAHTVAATLGRIDRPDLSEVSNDTV